MNARWWVRTSSVWAFFTISAALAGTGLGQSQAAPEEAMPAEWRDGGALVSLHRSTGKVRFLATVPGRPIQNAAIRDRSPSLRRATAVEATRGFLSRHGSLFGLRNPNEELTVTREKTADRGRTFVRFQQRRRGVPVLGGELVVQLNQDQNILSVHGEILPDIDVTTEPAVDGAAAQDLAREAVAKWHRMDAAALRVSEPELWIYHPPLIGPDAGVTALVWRMEVTPAELLPIRELVLVDASRGSLPLHFNQVPTARNRATYTANNSPFLPGDLVCDETNPNCIGGDSHAVSAHRYAGDAYDFYSSVHGRDGLDDAGMPIQSTVHYDFNYDNAFWDGAQLVYGDGCNYPLADDVVAHEFSHGVTDYESRLFYYYQSGAINESLSDVWGELVDLTNGSGNDTAGMRWVIGENVSGPAGCGPLRNMKNPPAYGHPDKMTSPRYYKGGADSGGVHTNSGVNNKAAALMTDGGTFNGRTVTALGITKVARIYYEVQTNLLVSGSDYADLYDALYQACSNLVGTAGITPSDCQEVRDATDAVEMSKQPKTNFNSEAPVCDGVGKATDLFVDNLDDSGGANFAFFGNHGAWALGSFYASSGSDHLWGDDSYAFASESAQMTLNVALPAGSRPYLRFRHAFGFEEPNFDGGVVEYSTDDGATWMDAGPLFDFNGYNGTADRFNFSLPGRRAFVGDSHGYISSRLKLASLAGQNVRFRFRIGTDMNFFDLGWFVDDLRIYTCSGGVLQFNAAYGVGEAGPSASVTVTRTGSTEGTVEVSYATSDGTAGSLDYDQASGVLTFGNGVASRTFAVPIHNDTLDEANETIGLALSSPTNFATLGPRDTATLTITDNDSGGTIQLNLSYSANEADGTASIAVTRSGGVASGVDVSYATSDGSATAGSDYTGASGTLTFGAGELSKSFVITILNDGLAEGNETIQLALSNPSGGAVLGPRKNAVLTVSDDEIGLVLDSASYMVSESGPVARITVKRTGPTGAAVGVSYKASDGTATGGLDYGATDGTLSLASGVLQGTFNVPILNDSAAEGNEALVLSLFNPTGGAVLGPQNTAVLTIADNDASLLKFSAASYSVGENRPLATITVSRTGSRAGTVGVSYTTGDGTATTLGSDYGAASGTLTFGPGVMSRTFTVPILDDSADESNETVNLVLTSPGGGASLGAPAVSVLTILDNEAGGTLQLNLASYTANETAGSASILVTRTAGAAGGVSVDYATSDDTAAAGSDYGATSGTLLFGAGELSKSFVVPILDDASGEGPETLEISLGNPLGGAVLGGRRSAPLKIVDDESALGGTLQFTLASYTVNETGGALTIAVARSGGAAGGVSVDYATSDGSAAEGEDYESTSGTLLFGAGERTRSFVVPILDDPSGEGIEALGLALANPGGGAILGPRSTAVASIVDNEAALQLKMASFGVSEAGPAATILVTRTGPSQSTVGVNYSTGDGTASAGLDYKATSGTLAFGRGVVSRTFLVPILKDTLDEANETVNLTLSNPSGGIVLGAQSAAVLTIADDDAAGTLQFKSAAFNVGETGPTATIAVTRTGGAAGGVTVDYATGGGSAAAGLDYAPVSGTLSFGPGIASRTFTIPITNDTLDEINEEIGLALSDPTGGAGLGAQSTSVLSITDNDVAGAVQFKVASYSVSESGSSAVITVTRSGGAASGVTVDYGTSDGSATEGSDYSDASGTLNFGPAEMSKTFTVQILEDPSNEITETVILTLGNPTGGVVLGAPATAILFIADNE